MGRYITTTGTAAPVLREVSTTYTAEPQDRILADSSSGAFTITLPAAADTLVGDVVQIIDVTGSFATNNVTVGRNGSNINSDASDLTLDINGAIVTLIYTNVTYGWVISST